VRRNMAGLGIVVLFVTALAPFARLIGTLCVLIRTHEAIPPRHLRRVFALAEKLRPWSMIDVLVFGVFVAYVKLGDVVTIGLAVGVYALLALTFVLVWMDSAQRPGADAKACRALDHATSARAWYGRAAILRVRSASSRASAPSRFAAS
jgi:paraquat-inducible protein A